MTDFAYSVAIKLSLANMASKGIQAIAGDLMGLYGTATKVQEKLGALKMAAVGYGLDRAGKGIFGFLEKSVDASKEYTRQLSLMNAAGMSQKDIAEGIAAAWSTSRTVITTTAADNLKAIRELRSVLGVDRLGDVGAVLPAVQRVKSVLEAVTGKAQEGTAFDVIKAVDLRTSGLMSKESITRNADLMSRTIMAMGGTITAQDFLMALKQSKAAALTFDDTFVYDYLPTLIQEVKTKGGSGSSAATALVTLSQAIVGGVVKKSSIPLWEQMGLINSKDVVSNATGQLQVRPGGVKDSALFAANPLAWFEKYAPNIEGYASKNKLSVLDTVMGLFGNRNAQWIANTFLEKAPQFERDRKLIESSGSSSYDTFQKLLQTNPQLAQQAMHAQWENIQARLGYEILPRLIPYMIKFADVLDRLAMFMQSHSGALGVFAVTAVGLGAGLMLVGKALMTLAVIKFLGLSGSLTSAASGIGMLIGKIGLLGAAFAVGYGAGTLISKGIDLLITKLSGQESSLGSKIYDILHPNDGHPNPAGPGHLMARSGGRGVTVTHVYLDGKKIATAVNARNSKALAAPQTGPSLFDNSLTPMPAGGSGF